MISILSIATLGSEGSRTCEHSHCSLRIAMYSLRCAGQVNNIRWNLRHLAHSVESHGVTPARDNEGGSL
jgi:hypothetical protein